LKIILFNCTGVQFSPYIAANVRQLGGRRGYRQGSDESKRWCYLFCVKRSTPPLTPHRSLWAGSVFTARNRFYKSLTVRQRKRKCIDFLLIFKTHREFFLKNVQVVWRSSGLLHTYGMQGMVRLYYTWHILGITLV